MASDFEFSADYSLENEGGYSDDPNDPGGATNYGITMDDLARYRGHKVAPIDVKNLSVNEAKAILKKFYWVPLNCDHINSRIVSTAIFDTGLLYGIRIAATYAQMICRQLVKPLDVDSVIGPVTTGALNTVDPHEFLSRYYLMIVDHITDLIDNNHKLEVFRAGWMNRANRLLTLS